MQSLDDFRALTVDGQVAIVDQWMCTANDILLGRCRKTKPRDVVW